MSKLPKVFFGPEIWSLQNEGGISRYFQQLINTLSRRGVNGKVLTQSYFNSRIPSSDLKNIQIEVLKDQKNPYVEISNMLSLEGGFNIFHPTYYSRNLVEIKKRNTKIVLTVFDMISEIFPERKPLFRKVVDDKKISLEKADHILSISNQTKLDLMRIYGIPKEKITVIYLGTNLNQLPKVDMGKSVKEPFILYVGKRNGYKNFSNFITAYSHSKFLKSYFSIVAVGGGDLSSNELSQFQKLGIDGKITQIDVSDEKLAMYYRTAACLVYPSLYEGFGLPPIEAMSLNCVVIASSEGSIPEICTNAAQYFNPKSVESIQYSIESTLADEKLMIQKRRLGSIVAQTFTWDKTATETLNAYKKLIAE